MRNISEYTLKKASEHVSYEAWMFFETLELLKKSKDQKTTNILLDAYSIHCRNLFDFLYPKNGPRDDDILVTDYIENNKNYNRYKTKKKELKFIVRKADKQVAHLTYSRNKFGKKNKPWPVVDIGNKMHRTLRTFYESMPHKYQKWPNFLALKQLLDGLN